MTSEYSPLSPTYNWNAYKTAHSEKNNISRIAEQAVHGLVYLCKTVCTEPQSYVIIETLEDKLYC